MKVKDILNRKGNKVIAVSPHDSVLDALKLMSEKNIGGVLVMQGEKLEGIFTERDYARKIILKGKSSAEAKISDTGARSAGILCEIMSEHASCLDYSKM